MRSFPCGEGDDSSHHAAEIGNEARATAARVTSRVRAAHRPFDAAARLCAKYAWSESRVMFSNDGTAIEGRWAAAVRELARVSPYRGLRLAGEFLFRSR